MLPPLLIELPKRSDGTSQRVKRFSNEQLAIQAIVADSGRNIRVSFA
ncbi:MAG: hypothetical protein OFPII_21650 [Osedax symbiont Rs1]|nr:MAG: hypothetical protein OFPII_21650 [Osedax symbiont Rs1]